MEQKKLHRINLKTAEDVRRYIARLIKRVENDEIELGKARVLMQLAEGILKSIRTDELERKIIEIENALDGGYTASNSTNNTADNVEDFTEYLNLKQKGSK